MPIENHRQLHHTFFESYIYQDNILSIKWSSKTTLSHISWVINCFIHTKHFLSHKALRNKFYCRSININSFITHVLSLLVFRKKFQRMMVLSTASLHISWFFQQSYCTVYVTTTRKTILARKQSYGFQGQDGVNHSYDKL